MNDLLLKIAIADAYGMGFEFVPQEIVDTENNLSGYRYHGLHSELMPGQYTDDTQMTIALFEFLKGILGSKELPYGYNEQDFNKIICNKEAIADSFLKTFKRDPRKGYAKGFQTVLETTKSGKELIEKIELNGKTESNGAAMRAIPGGLLSEIKDVIKFTEIQSSITHRDGGVVAAKAIAVASFLLKNDQVRLSYLGDEINNIMKTNIDWSWNGFRVISKTELGIITARAAIHTLMTTKSFTECLKKSVSYGGDTDSVAAIACGLSTLSSEHFDKQIPESLLGGLERGPYGFEYLYNLRF